MMHELILQNLISRALLAEITNKLQKVCLHIIIIIIKDITHD